MPTIRTSASPVTATAKGRRPTSAPPKRYDLFATDGSVRRRLQLTDEGVSPGPSVLEFMLDRRWTSQRYDDIDTVAVSSSAQSGSASIAICRIAFFDGSEVHVSSANANGLSDGTRDIEFNDFVKDLHRRLVASGDAQDISFRAGYGPARSWALIVSLIAAAGLFVVLPVALFFLTRRAELLLMTPFGLLLIFPGAKLFGINRPGSYRPDAPPNFPG